MSILDYLFLKYRNSKAPGVIGREIKKKEELVSILEDRTKFLNKEYDMPHYNQRIYHIWFDDYDVDKCPYCELPKKWNSTNRYCLTTKVIKGYNYIQTCGSVDCSKKCNHDKTKKSIQEKYGVDNISQTEEWKEKVKKTNQEKYGVDWQSQSANFKTKTLENSRNKYGVDHPTQLESVQNKKRITNLSKYGVEYPIQLEDTQKRVRITNIIKYGYEYISQVPEFKEKSKITCQEKYGNDTFVGSNKWKEVYPLSMQEKYKVFNSGQLLVNRNSFKFKDYKFPSGKIVKVQGYESKAIDLLLQSYQENDIIIEDQEIENCVGKIWYFDKDEIPHRYFPDIYIKSENKVIEVKSNYTYQVNLETTKLKEAACLSKNIKFEFMVL